MQLSKRNPTPPDDGFGRMAERMFNDMFNDMFDGQRVVVEAECQRANEQRQGEQVVYSERSTRRYQRSFSLPAEVDYANAEARLEDGILRLTLPKKQGSSARRLTIS